MTVQDMINELQEIEDKSIPVYLETEDFCTYYKPTSIQERRRFVEICTCFETMDISEIVK